MVRVVVRRLLQLVVTLLGLTVLVFVWLRSLPGGPVEALLGERATPEKRAVLRRALGYDESIWVQYGKFMKRLLTGDLGASTTKGDAVLDVIGRAFPATIELSIAAMLFAVALGIPLGYFAARNHGRLIDNLIVIGTLVGVAVPVFFRGYVL